MNGVWLERDIGGTQYNRNTIRKVGNDQNVISKSTEKSIPHLWSVTLYKILKLHPSGVFDYLKHDCTRNQPSAIARKREKTSHFILCLGIIVLTCILGERKWKVLQRYRVGSTFTEYTVSKRAKGWKTAYCRARWYQNPTHYRLKEKSQYRKPRPTRLISEFAYFFNLHCD